MSSGEVDNGIKRHMSHTFLNTLTPSLTLGVDYYFSCQMPFQILSAPLSNMASNYENRHLSLTAADHQFDMDVGRGIPL